MVGLEEVVPYAFPFLAKGGFNTVADCRCIADPSPDLTCYSLGLTTYLYMVEVTLIPTQWLIHFYCAVKNASDLAMCGEICGVTDVFRRK